MSDKKARDKKARDKKARNKKARNKKARDKKARDKKARDKKARTPRRTHSAAFKSKAVKLVVVEKVPVAEVAQDLGLNAGTLRRWIQSSAQQDDTLVVEDDCTELERLRKEHRLLLMEVEILKKSAEFFAGEDN